MEIIIFFGLSGAFLIWGIVFIIKGFHHASSDELNAVPISDLEEIKELNQVAPNLESPPGSTRRDVVSSIPAVSAAPVVKPISVTTIPGPSSCAAPVLTPPLEAQAQIEKLAQEKQKLQDALKRELTSKAPAAISEEQWEQIQNKDRQLFDARRCIQTLENEKSQLKEHVENLAPKIREMEQRLEASNSALAGVKEEYHQFQSLKDLEMEQAQIRNQEMLVQLKLTGEKIQTLQEDVEFTQKSNDQKLTQATAILKKQLEEAFVMIEDLRKEKDELLQVKEDLDLNVLKIKEFNAHLLNKEKMLQYELVKHRAQAMGLEKICEDFKLQIDGMSKSVESTSRIG